MILEVFVILWRLIKKNRSLKSNQILYYFVRLLSLILDYFIQQKISK